LAIYESLAGGGQINALPGTSEGMIALLGISHAGYLSVKAVNHSSPPASSAADGAP
jgi:hypothetical protein